MMEPLRRFEFPPKTLFTRGLIAEAPTVDPSAVDAAITRGYEEGLQRGREAGVEELKRALHSAQTQGREAGRQEALAAIQVIADQLRAALAAVEQAATTWAADAEHFCVELTLAAIAKLAAIEPVQSKFIKRAISQALTTLAPLPATAILVHPAAADAIQKEFPDLPVRGDAQVEAGAVRIDGGRLLVESSINQALAELRDAIITVRARRAPQRIESPERP